MKFGYAPEYRGVSEQAGSGTDRHPNGRTRRVSGLEKAQRVLRVSNRYGASQNVTGDDPKRDHWLAAVGAGELHLSDGPHWMNAET